MKKILTPVDFSDATRGVVDASIALASSIGARIVLLHAVQPPVVTSEYGLALENVRELLELSEQAASRQLEHLVLNIKTKGLDVCSEFADGTSVDTILKAAKKHNPAYIVLGSHGHTAIYDLLVGSTTHGVLKKSPCPVVIVPPSKAPKKKAKKKASKRS